MTYTPDEFEELVDLSFNPNNKMDKLRNVANWIVFSSANRNKFSLSLKAGIPFLVLLGVSDTETLNQLVGSVGELVAVVAQSILGLITAWGVLRKIWYLYK